MENFFIKWYELTSLVETMVYSDPFLSKIIIYSADIYDLVFIIGLFIAIFSILIYLVFKKENKWLYIKETITNMFTLVPYYFTELFFWAAAVAIYFLIYWNISWHLPVNLEMFVLVIFLADFVYFVEHYYAHKIRLFWMAHSVHHSSPIMNISVAFRFSFLDPIIWLIFHIPLILLGFHPILVFSAEILVQAYQFWIHTEKIGKMWFLEWILNTPSAHRVHHASNLKYLDKNFWWITVIWDRVFWTYKEEDEKVNYWLTKQINSANPITVQFFEICEVAKDLWHRKWFINKLKTLYKWPGWKPKTLKK